MKKIVFAILLVLSLVACFPKFRYFSAETSCPQRVVDSLYNDAGLPTSDYRTWTSFEVVGINQGDSTLISTYVNVIDRITISVTTYGNSEMSTVRKKRVRAR